MSRNLIRYEGRFINRKGDAKLEKSRNGKGRVQLVIAEQFQERNDRAPEKYKDPAKPADAYVNTETKWHRLDIWGSLEAGSQLLELLANPDFNHGAILEIDASYRSQGWTSRKDNVNVQDDRETVFLDQTPKDDGFDTTISIKTSRAGNLLGASDGFAKPIYTGGDIPELGSGGGGRPAAPQYGDDEGF